MLHLGRRCTLAQKGVAVVIITLLHLLLCEQPAFVLADQASTPASSDAHLSMPMLMPEQEDDPSSLGPREDFITFFGDSACDSTTARIDSEPERLQTPVAGAASSWRPLPCTSGWSLPPHLAHLMAVHGAIVEDAVGQDNVISQEGLVVQGWCRSMVTGEPHARHCVPGAPSR